MDWLQAATLGVVQGLTEFLPVSSSGHLVLAREMLGLEAATTPSFEVVVHLGTLASIMLVMRQPVLAVVRAVPLLARPGSWPVSWVANQGFRHLVLGALATLPTVLVALFFKDAVDALFSRPMLAAAMLLVTAAIVFSTRWAPKPGSIARIGWRTALMIGLAQALAITPGISRSGSTIAAGMWRRADREEVGAFSFLMAIPAIIGAALLHGRDIARLEESPAALAWGFLASFVVGSLALMILLKLLRRGRLWVFAPYLLVVGSVYVLFFIIS